MLPVCLDDLCGNFLTNFENICNAAYTCAADFRNRKKSLESVEINECTVRFDRLYSSFHCHSYSVFLSKGSKFSICLFLKKNAV